MKKIIASVLALFVAVVGFAAPGNHGMVRAARASEERAGVQEEAQARDMFIAYADSIQPARKPKPRRRGRPGAKVRIELLRNSERKYVPVHTTFRAGDKVKFHFAVNFPAYVSVLNLGSSGRFAVLFPYAGAPEVVGVTKDYTVPHRDNLWFEFDDKPGAERLTFVFSTARLLATGSEQTALDDLNSHALANGKDLNLVQVSDDEGYVFCDEQQLRKPLGFQIVLRHGR